MPFNYSRLCGRIVEKFSTQMNFARAMELSDRTVSLKLNSKVDWKQSEIARACNLLDIDESEIPDYFFNAQVQNNRMN